MASPLPNTHYLHLPFLYPFSHSLCFPFLSVCVYFHLCSLSFSPPHVVLLFIPLYSFPPSPPLLSSLTHIWFLSLGLCVFGVTQSSLGLPALMYVCVWSTQREMECVYVCRLMGLPAWACVCRVQQGSSRLCNSLICGSFRGRLHPIPPQSFSILPFFVYLPELFPVFLKKV